MRYVVAARSAIVYLTDVCTPESDVTCSWNCLCFQSHMLCGQSEVYVSKDPEVFCSTFDSLLLHKDKDVLSVNTNLLLNVRVEN